MIVNALNVLEGCWPMRGLLFEDKFGRLFAKSCGVVMSGMRNGKDNASTLIIRRTLVPLTFIIRTDRDFTISVFKRDRLRSRQCVTVVKHYTLQLVSHTPV